MSEAKMTPEDLARLEHIHAIMVCLGHTPELDPETYIYECTACERWGYVTWVLRSFQPAGSATRNSCVPITR